MIIVSGSSNPLLSQQIAQTMNLELANVHISKFPNGEKRIWVRSDLQDKTAVIVQSFSEPVDEHIIEFCLLADACKHKGAKRIFAVIPWLGYSPQDKTFRDGEPISAHVVSRIIESVGVTDLLTLDIHSQKTLEFFSIPTHEITSLPIFVEHIKTLDYSNFTVISIDKGSRLRSEQFAKALDLPICTFEKTRDRASGEVKLTHISGEVEGKTAISFDDFISTGSTQIGACEQLKSMGIKSYIACVTHAVFAGTDTAHRLQDSDIDMILTTDTYAIPPARNFLKLKILSCAQLIGKSLNTFIRLESDN